MEAVKAIGGDIASSDTVRRSKAAPGAPTPQRLDWLQVGRAIAAVSVCLYHAGDQMTKRAPEIGAFQLFHDGRLGVDLFFVISGFIICYIHAGDIGRPERLARYAYRRITRIYPLYWLVFLSVLPIYFAFPSAGVDSIREPLSILRCVLLLPNPPDGQTIGVAWTLVYEVSFYALFAVLIVNRWAGALVIGAWALLMVLINLGLFRLGYLTAFFSIRYLEFAIGAGVFVLSRHYRPRKALWIAGCACVALFTIGLVWPDASALLDDKGGVLIAGVLSGLVVFGLVATPDDRLHASKIGRAVSKVGDASYSIYLVHWLIGWVLDKIYGKLDPPSAMAGPFFLVLMVAMIGGGLVFHFVVERRLMDFFSAEWRRRQAMAPRPT